MNRKDLQALTLLGPPSDNPEPDPLAVLHLKNLLFIYYISSVIIVINSWSH